MHAFPRVTGFTLMELLISIAIFLIITAMVIVNFSSGKYRDELVGAGSILQAAVREAQALTNAGATALCPGQVTPAVPVGGFGAYFKQPSTVYVFADCETTNSRFAYSASDDTVVRTIQLSDNVTLDNSSQPALPVSLVFSSLIETVAVNGQESYANPVSLVLAHSRSGYHLNVSVNAITGQVFTSQPQLSP